MPRHSKKISELTAQNFESMSKGDLIRFSGAYYGGASGTDLQSGFLRRPGSYKLRGHSTAKHADLAKYIQGERNHLLAARTPFYRWNTDRKAYVENADPVVQWGKITERQKIDAHRLAVEQLSKHLPPDMVTMVTKNTAPTYTKHFDVGDVVYNMPDTWSVPTFYRVVGHTKTGRARLQQLEYTKVGSQAEGDYVYTSYRPSSSVAPGSTPKALHPSRWSVKKWNGRNVRSSLDLYH